VRASKCRLFSAHGFPGFFGLHDSARESHKLPVGAVRKKINGSVVYIRAKCCSNYIEVSTLWNVLKSVQHD
jgi:hypothetical protein